MTIQSTRQDEGGIAGFVEDLNGAIRENPVAAGLVGMGVLWMFFGNARISAFASGVPGAATSATKAVGASAQATGGMLGDAIAGTASRVSEAARQVGDAISSSAEAAATTVRETASAGYDALRSNKSEDASETVTCARADAARSNSDYGRDLGFSLQQNLTQTLERQPLLLGVIGLAIGAGIASAFPSTKIEQDVMGEAGAAVKDTFQEIATVTSEHAKEVFDEVKKEAAAQGLTPSAAKEGLKQVAENVKTAATSSGKSVKSRLS
jgi:hypothetical protein